MAFRSPINVERYEDVCLRVGKHLLSLLWLTTLTRRKQAYRFIANNNGEIAPFDWYAARFVIDF